MRPASLVNMGLPAKNHEGYDRATPIKMEYEKFLVEISLQILQSQP